MLPLFPAELFPAELATCRRRMKKNDRTHNITNTTHSSDMMAMTVKPCRLTCKPVAKLRHRVRHQSKPAPPPRTATLAATCMEAFLRCGFNATTPQKSSGIPNIMGMNWAGIFCESQTMAAYVKPHSNNPKTIPTLAMEQFLWGNGFWLGNFRRRATERLTCLLLDCEGEVRLGKSATQSRDCSERRGRFQSCIFSTGNRPRVSI